MPASVIEIRRRGRRIVAARGAAHGPRGTSEDVSLSSLAMYVGGYTLWLVYGLAIGSVPLVMVDVVGVLAGRSRWRWRWAFGGLRPQ
jgi:hypothetical protein